MKVCIAEKPSVAREIANILGAKSRKDGYFEGNGYAVTWTFGHFCSLYEPDDYKPHWKSWSLDNLPMLPEKFETKLKNDKGVKKQFKIIKTLFKKATLVINCGDAGQEGELIQRWVLKQAKYKGKVLRLWISSLTSEAIREGFKNLKKASDYDNLYYAGSSRAIGDWLLGMNATRLYTLKYGGYKQVLSVGRVQTPTLAMVVKRHQEIENFVPQTYWELQTIYREVNFNYEKGKFTKKEEGAQLLETIKGKPFSIISTTKKKGKELPPKLFDLTSLQVYCNNKFGYSADQTLKIAQKLYEQKVVSYPRVDTSFLPNDVYPKVPGILGKMNSYSQFTAPLLNTKLRKSTKVFNDKKVTDHHAIIPTGYEKTLPFIEQRVYDIIARRFIAAFYPDCIVSNTTVMGEVEKIPFKATGKEILEEGWRVVLPSKKSQKSTTDDSTDKEKNSKDNEEKILPEFKKGETGPHEPQLAEKQTKPPKYYTEATLLRAMETAGKQVDDEELRELMKGNGIGRPSTRAGIIETLFRRKYIIRKKKQLHATPTGVQLIDTIQNELLKSAELTGQWEQKLKEIEQGEYNAGRFIANMKTMVDKLVTEVRMSKATSRISKEEVPSKVVSRQIKKQVSLLEQKCPKCKKGTLLKGKNNYGCSEWKTGCKFRLPFEYMEKAISEKQLIRLVNTGATIILKGFKSQGKTINGRLAFNTDFELKLNPTFAPKKAAIPKKKATVPDKLTCPKCKKGKILKGKTAYGCSNWKNGCKFKMDFATVREKAKGKEMTKELVWGILKGK
jgi:DNA topoisomerase-3